MHGVTRVKHKSLILPTVLKTLGAIFRPVPLAFLIFTEFGYLFFSTPMTQHKCDPTHHTLRGHTHCMVHWPPSTFASKCERYMVYLYYALP